MVTQDMEKAEVMKAFFAPVFTSKTSFQESQAPEIRDKIWSRGVGPDDFLRSPPYSTIL